jgi:hypothetical protein
MRLPKTSNQVKELKSLNFLSWPQQINQNYQVTEHYSFLIE